MARKGYIYKGKKAVYWCPNCETALAEAEIEYKDRKSPSIYVKFPAVDVKGLAPEGVAKEKLFAVIWTTTPWTIPANEAICVNPKFTYVWVHNKAADEYYLMNKELAPKALEECKVTDYEFVGREMTGAEWELATFHHPCWTACLMSPRVTMSPWMPAPAAYIPLLATAWTTLKSARITGIKTAGSAHYLPGR